MIAPTVRDGAIMLDEVQGVDDLPIGWTDEQDAAVYRLRRHDARSLFQYAVGPASPRRFLSPPRRRLWSAERSVAGFEVSEERAEPPAYAFVGVRACELAAIAVQDRILRDGDVP